MPNLPDLLHPTTPDWLTAVRADLDAFLADHASCEKKAAGMAMNVASHYPDKPQLLLAMADLAVEEMAHYREVLRLLLARGARPAPDRKDAYINGLHQALRRGSEWFLLDRLVVAAVVEARGFERFSLLADGLEDPTLGRFYRGIAASEGRHWQLFLDLAGHYYDAAVIQTRTADVLALERALICAQPLAPRLH